MVKKLFILGIGGLTGSKLAVLAKNDFEVYGSYNLRNPKLDFVTSFKLDITDTLKTNEILSSTKPNIILNASALTNVDYCENHKEEAKKINIDAVDEMAKISNTLGSTFVQLSSDSIFDGTKSMPYKENDNPNPINIYGYTKLMGEKIVLKNPKNLVVRASVLYGWLPENLSQLDSSSMKPSNFAQWLKTKLCLKEKIKVITDEYSSPIIADDFARSILHLIKGNYSGIFHSAPPIQITRYDFSVRLAKALELDYNLIQRTTNRELGRNVTTGFNKCLDSSKIRKETHFHFLTLDESFAMLKNQISN